MKHKKLETLEEHNRNRFVVPLLKEDYKNGVACPNCGEELYTVIGVTITSQPPQSKIYCKADGCGFIGSMF